jgi:hypothetical protein
MPPARIRYRPGLTPAQALDVYLDARPLTGPCARPRDLHAVFAVPRAALTPREWARRLRWRVRHRARAARAPLN